MAKSGTSAPGGFTQEYVVLQRQTESVLYVTVSQWETFMNRIQSCGDSSGTYNSVGWACLGIAASALLSAITFPFGVKFTTPIPTGGDTVNLGAVLIECSMAVLALAGAGVGAVTLLFSRQHRKDRSDLRSWIVDDMRQHKDKHSPQARPGQSAIAPPPAPPPAPAAADHSPATP
jgi:hypothetical protein